MQQLIKFYNQYGVLGIAGVIGLVETGLLFFLPDEGLLIYLGVRVRISGQSVAEIVSLITPSVLIGSSALYWLVRWKGHPLLLRYGRYIGLKQQRVEQAELLLRRWGHWAILVGRLTPGLRLSLTTTAGLLKFPYPRFLAIMLIAVPLWTLMYLGFGYYLGVQAMRTGSLVRQAFQLFESHRLLSLALGGALLLLYIMLRRRATRVIARILGFFGLRAKRVDEVAQQPVHHVADWD